MTLCPIAVVAGCRKCPAFSICPLKGVIGDYKPQDDKSDETVQPAAKRPASKRRAGKR